MRGSSGSRRVARSTRVRCSATSRWTTAASSGSSPTRSATARASGAPVRAWSCAPGSLPRSCSSAGEQQQVGALHLAQERLRGDGGLDEVAVHGPAVDGVALGAVADRGPLRDPLLDEADEVEGLPDGDLRGAGGEQFQQRLAGGGRPRDGQRGAGGDEVLQRHRGQRQPHPHGGRGGAQRQDGVLGRADPGAEDDLAVVLDEAVAQRAQPGAATGGAEAAGGQRLPGPAGGDVDGGGDRAGGLRDGGQQQVGVGVAADDGGGVLLGQDQPVPRAPRGRLQAVADVEQDGVGLVDGAVRAVGEPARGQGAQRDRVAQAAAGLLEVGFEQVGELAEARGALGEGVQDLRQAPAGPGAPVVEQVPAGAGHQAAVAGEDAQVEQPGAGGEVGGGDLAALLRGAHRVVQAQALVPQRVPDPVGEGRDVVAAQAPAVVQQDEVDVAGGAAVAAGQRADAGQRHPGGVVQQAGRDLGERGQGLGPHVAQPGLDELHELGAAVRAGSSGPHRQRESLGAQVGAQRRPVRDGFTRGLLGVGVRARRGRARRCARARRPRRAGSRPCRRRCARSGRS